MPVVQWAARGQRWAKSVTGYCGVVYDRGGGKFAQALDRSEVINLDEAEATKSVAQNRQQQI